MTFCFDIGGTKIVGARVDEYGVVGEPCQVPTPVSDRQALVQTLRSMLPDDETAVGISIAGVINPDDGRLASANIPCVSGLDLSTELGVSLARPVTVINDADAFALAETYHGAAHGHSVVLAIILGTGVGGAIVLDGQLHAGRGGLAGEWGHGPAATSRSDVSLPLLACDCGQTGCVDTLGGARGIERIHAHLHRRMSDSHRIVAAWFEGQADAVIVIDCWLDMLGGALAAAVNLLGPTIVPVGGGLATAGPLIDALDRQVCSRSLLPIEAGLLYAAPTGARQALIGAALQVRQQRERQAA